MLINSKFRDYYDSCLGFGIDKTVVYNRAIEKIPSGKILEPNSTYNKVLSAFKDWGPEISHRRGVRGTPCNFDIVGIGFCGHLFKAVSEGVLAPADTSGYYKSGTHYSIDSMSEELRRCRVGWMSNLTVGDYFQEILTRENVDPFLILNAPTFIITDSWIVINPYLTHLNFGKIRGGVDAFQELSAFISGVLGASRAEPLPITDELRAHSKGFDKNSFRKGPTKCKKK